MTDTTRDLIQRMARALDLYRQMALDDYTSTHPFADEARAVLSQPKSEGPPLEPRGCPTPGACSCPTSPTVPPELIRALELAEAALADIGEAEREPGDDLAWAEARAAQDLPRIRIALDRWGRPATEPVPVSERHWEREGWCDAKGQCWMGDGGGNGFVPSWRLCNPSNSRPFPWSLPHYALPVPAPETNGQT